MIIQTIIVGDDQHSVDQLAGMVRDAVPPLPVDVVAVSTDPADAMRKVSAFRPQLVIVDIATADGSDFESFLRHEVPGVALIVAAPTDKYALRALKAGAVDYLIKPVQPEELKEAFEKISARKNDSASRQLEMLMTYFKPEKPKVRRLALTASDHLVFVDTGDIIYCESDSNYTTFFLVSGEKVMISKTLKDVEELLQGDGFFRIHASYLINMKHVSRFTRGDGGYVVMSNNQNITVSRKKKEEFFERFSKL